MAPLAPLPRLLAPGLAGLLAACAAPRAEPSGFLGDTYGKMIDAPAGDDARVFLSPSLDLARYDAVHLLPVEFWLDAGAEYRGVRADELALLADELEASLGRALAERYALVDPPRPGALLLRVAITDLRPTRPVVHTVTQVPGPLRSASTVKRILTGTHLGVGWISIEAELLDGTSEEVVAAFMDLEVGSKLRAIEGLTEWGHVRSAFDDWAARLRDRLDEAHAR